MKPDEITEEEFRSSDFPDDIVDSNGVEVFGNARLAYDFYRKHKDDIVTISIEKMRGPAGDNDAFMNTIDFGNEVFYIDSYDYFIEYMKNR